MKNIFVIPTVSVFIFTVFIARVMTGYAASEQAGDNVKAPAYIDLTPKDNPDEISNVTNTTMQKHPGWNGEPEMVNIEKEKPQQQVQNPGPGVVSKDPAREDVFNSFKRQSNRTGPVAENKEGSQSAANENDYAIQTQTSTAQSKYGPVPVEATASSQLPDFKPVVSKKGPS